MERMAYMFEKKQKRMWSSNTKKVCRKGKLVEAVDKSWRKHGLEKREPIVALTCQKRKSVCCLLCFFKILKIEKKTVKEEEREWRIKTL